MGVRVYICIRIRIVFLASVLALAFLLNVPAVSCLIEPQWVGSTAKTSFTIQLGNEEYVNKAVIVFGSSFGTIQEEDIITNNTFSLSNNVLTVINHLEPYKRITVRLTPPEQEGNYSIGVIYYTNSGSHGYEESIQVDRTPPNASITYPVRDGNVSGIVDVLGFAADAGTGQGDGSSSFDSYYVKLVKLAEDTPSGPYHLVCSSREPSASVLCEKWDSANYEDGAYNLVIDAFDMAGNGVSYAVPITVDNTPPSLELSADKTLISSGKDEKINFKVLAFDKLTGLKKSAIELSSPSGKLALTQKNGFYESSAVLNSYNNTIFTAKVEDYAKNEILSKLVVDAAPPIIEEFTPGVLSVRSGGTVPLTIRYVEFNVKEAEIKNKKLNTKPVRLELPNSSADNPIASQTFNFTVNESLEGGFYELELTITDLLDRKESAITRIRVDNTPPTVVPSIRKMVYGVQNFVAKVKDVSGIRRVYFIIEGKRYVAESVKGEYKVKVDTSEFPEGDHALKIVAEDRAGNTATKTVRILIDRLPPVIKTLEVAPKTSKSVFYIKAYAHDNASSIVRAEYSISADGNGGGGVNVDVNVKSPKYEVKGVHKDVEMKPVDGIFDSNNEYFYYRVNASDLEAGEYVVFVRVKDESGRWSKELSEKFQIDRSLDSELSVDVDTSSEAPLVLEQGGANTTTVHIENRGKISATDISATTSSEEIFVEVEDKGLIAVLGPGENRDIMVRIKSKDNATMGLKSVPLIFGSSDSSREAEVNLTVRIVAGNVTRKRINETLDAIRKKLNELKHIQLQYGRYNTSQEWKNITIGISRSEEALENVSEQLRAYNYSINSTLEYIAGRLEDVEKDLIKLAEKYHEDEKSNYILLLGLAILGMLGVIAAFIMVPSKSGFDSEKGYTQKKVSPISILLEAKIFKRARRILKRWKCALSVKKLFRRRRKVGSNRE